MTDDEVLASMEQKFGEENTDQYVRLAKATRSLVHLWGAYAAAPDGSLAERVIEAQLERMLSGMKTRPEHALGMIESLLALVHHMRNGGSYEQWFAAIGIAAEPGGEDRG
jgi:hypothetical protein